MNNKNESDTEARKHEHVENENIQTKITIKNSAACNQISQVLSIYCIEYVNRIV